MRVLVTGGGGFLGREICRQLLERGDRPVAFQRSPAPGLASDGAECIRGDVADFDQVTSAMQGCAAVIHTAGKAGVWGPYRDYYRANVMGTENVITACRESGIRFLVHTSSPSAVHAGGDIEGGDESLPYPRRFRAAYPETKALGEQLVLAANAGAGLATVSLRPHLIWGPGDPHLVPRLMERARGGVLKLPGPDKLIDTVYVTNAARAHLLALDELLGRARCAGKAYFISNGEPLPQAEIIGRLLKATGMEAEIRPIAPAVAIAAGTLCQLIWKIPGFRSEPPVTQWSAEQLSTAHWFNISASGRDFNYRPEVSIDAGLQRLAAYFSGQPPAA